MLKIRTNTIRAYLIEDDKAMPKIWRLQYAECESYPLVGIIAILKPRYSSLMGNSIRRNNTARMIAWRHAFISRGRRKDGQFSMGRGGYSLSGFPPSHGQGRPVVVVWFYSEPPRDVPRRWVVGGQHDVRKLNRPDMTSNHLVHYDICQNGRLPSYVAYLYWYDQTSNRGAKKWSGIAWNIFK